MTVWQGRAVCWRLDRLGRNLKHLITLLDELQAMGVAFVSLAERIDATTPGGEAAAPHPGRHRRVQAGANRGTSGAGLALARGQVLTSARTPAGSGTQSASGVSGCVPHGVNHMQLRAVLQ